MRTIVLGYIHANLHALTACWELAQSEGFDRIFHTGDVVGYGAFPNECVAFLRERNIPGVRGNFDDNIGNDGDESGAVVPASNGDEQALVESSFQWTLAQIEPIPKRWLADLPFEAREVADGHTIAVYHASPFDMRTTLEPDASDSRFEEVGQAARADIVVTGHRHKAFHRSLNRRHYIAAGSVGRPADGDPRTGFAVIQTGGPAEGEVKVEFRRLPYDLDAAADGLKRRGVPAELATRLTRGI